MQTTIFFRVKYGKAVGSLGTQEGFGWSQIPGTGSNIVKDFTKLKCCHLWISGC